MGVLVGRGFLAAVGEDVEVAASVGKGVFVAVAGGIGLGLKGSTSMGKSAVVGAAMKGFGFLGVGEIRLGGSGL